MCKHVFFVVGLLAALSSLDSLTVIAQSVKAAYDPVTMDPVVQDTAFPPAFAELAFESAGHRVNGLMYIATGRGPHPTVVHLHGQPGFERNTDLAQAMRRSGVNVFQFNYRGNWGSAGTFSRTSAIEDVAAAISYLRTPEIARRYRVNPERIALVGHSLGGWVALMAAAVDPSVLCVAGFDFGNPGATGGLAGSNPKADSTRTAYLHWLNEPGGPLRLESVAAIQAEMSANSSAWDLTKNPTKLAHRPVFIVSAINKNDPAALAKALRDAGAKQVAFYDWKTDHGMQDRRIEAARTLVGWLHADCRIGGR